MESSDWGPFGTCSLFGGRHSVLILDTVRYLNKYRMVAGPPISTEWCTVLVGFQTRGDRSGLSLLFAGTGIAGFSRSGALNLSLSRITIEVVYTSSHTHNYTYECNGSASDYLMY